MSNLIKSKDVATKPDYWKNICEMQEKQTRKGINKYGQTLEDNKDLTDIERITYLQEELIDGLMYCEHLKELIKNIDLPRFMPNKSTISKLCPKCDSLTESAYRHCLNCGYDFNEEVL